MKKALKGIACTESHDATWEIITNSHKEGKDLRFFFFDEEEDIQEMHLTYKQLKDLVKFLDRLRGKKKK